MEICKLEKCTGCFACKEVCPMNAIEVGQDKYGKTIPKVQDDKCIECGLCKNVCHVKKVKEARVPQKCYAAWTKKQGDREDCASGGIATGLGRYIISKGGVVFGAKYTKMQELNCIIDMTETEEGLEDFKSSKYVQADTAHSYRQAKEQLDRGRQVLYVGTPCQIAGLQGFLRRKYTNLITVDMVCHGVPPAKYLREYARSVCPDNWLERATFRGKYDYDMCFYEKDAKEPCYQKANYLDMYYESFLKCLIYRDNCYHCKYARKERISDLTIGDFWGLDRTTLIEPYEGRISEILVNTPKGQNIINLCKSLLHLEERPLEEAVKGNKQLNAPPVRHKDYDKFREIYPKGGFVRAVKATSIKKNIQRHRLGRTLPGRVFRKMRRVLRVRK
ncbi:MAG: Coenzyme F420 hydrogenase/dehydrogenase, beta subunit C-terminal domain [Lachnospiraceae bacterium]|nr:Coenzyme F420 hydrogenase/dehydrogenase, beta subunit C-terminal domain [Lachnospiraceae bacterium]